MDRLILQIYSRASASHIDISTRQKLLIENLDRIFADQGDVETWEYHGTATNLKRFVITSVEDFDRKCMVGMASIIDRFPSLTQLQDPQSPGNRSL